MSASRGRDGHGRLGSLIRQARRRAGLSQEQLADRSSLAVRTIRNLESGRIDRPRLQTLVLVADALVLDPVQREMILGGDAVGWERPVPRELPQPPYPFTGRAAELAAMTATLHRRWPRILVSGMPGVGKSALAIRFAHAIMDQFPDGHVYLDLRGYAEDGGVPASEALGRALRSLGVVFRSVGSRDGEADTLVDLARVSLALDHAEEAGSRAHDALSVSREIGDRGTESDALSCLAAARLKVGDRQEASNLASSALEGARAIGYQEGVLRALLVAADVQTAEGETGAAAQALNEASALARRCGFTVLLDEVERRRS